MKILIWLPNNLGDSLHTIPFLRVLKRNYPESRIDVIARENIASLAELYPGVDRVYPFSKKKYSGLIGKYRFGRMIAAQENYDVLFCLAESFSSAWVGYWTGSKVRIGNNTELRGFLLTHPLKLGNDVHNVHKTMKFLTALGRDGKDYQSEFLMKLDPALLEQAPLPPGKKLVLSLYGTVPSRCMPHARSVELINFLLRDYDYHIILTGVEGDRERLARVLAEVGPNDRIHNFAGKTDIRQLATIIEQADLVLSVDSGPAHLANVLGRNLIDLFGQADERFTGPFQLENARVLRVPNLPCAPCHKAICPLGDVRCLTLIDNTLIGQAIAELEG